MPGLGGAGSVGHYAIQFAKARGANVVTTEYSDWATNCPEYKVTAVQVAPAVHRSKWQDQFDANARVQGKILETS